jgi:mono/diheme cytochrome c family protein
MSRQWWLFLAVAAIASAQSKTVLDGVFTAAQVARGEGVYAAKCAHCHEGADVDGPNLTGDPFVDRWREDNLSTLFQFLKTRMPQDAPGSLDDKTYVDLVARLLEASHYPTGNTELTQAALDTTLLVGHDGPKPLPPSAMVVAVGCLAAGPDNTWMVTNTAKLSRTQNGDETSPDETKRSAAKALGTGSYRLNNAETPESKKGHKVQVKGVLNQQGNVERINVLSLESLAPTCAP